MRVFILVTLFMFLFSCKTWEGIKEDSKDVGQAIGEAAENVGKKIKEATE